jgi:myo-inositol-1(or 4)-monophosphatase
MHPSSYEVLLEQVLQVVQHAGELLIQEWQRPTGPRGSGDKAPIDFEIEEQLRPALLTLLACDFWGEETERSLSGHEFCWVVDPNDGTADFVAGRRGSAISVGLLHEARPVLGVVYAPVLQGRLGDCIAWSEGLPHILRNGLPVRFDLSRLTLSEHSCVMVSTAAARKPDENSQLCAPAKFVPMPSIAYRLARTAAGDAVAGVSLCPVSAHDVVAGHALLIGAGGVLIDQDGRPVSYETKASIERISSRCFGGAPLACRALASRDWALVLK